MTAQISQPEFGARLRKLRTELRLSQRDLASGAVNQSYISLLESGARVPTLDVIAHLAKMLDVPLRTLAGDIDLGSLDGSPDGPPPPSRDALVRELLAASAIDQGDLEQAEQQVRAMYDAAVAADAPTAVLSHGLALDRILELRADRPGRHDLLSRLLPVAEAAGVPEAHVRVLVSLSAAARDVGRLDEAHNHIERAQREIERTAFRNGSEHIKLLAVHISVLSDGGGGPEIVRLVKTMLAMAERLGNPAITGRAQWAASMALVGVGETDSALRLLNGARQMLANPSTSLRDWSRFSASAVSTLLDIGASPAEIEPYLLGVRASVAAEGGTSAARLAGLEVRYAVAAGDPQRAIDLAAAVDRDAVTGLDGVRFRHALATALARAGRRDEAAAELRGAAELAESISAYRRASQLWRELNELSRETRS
ncbi:helix-turn-helix domain-containing protein [Actinoplanes sp. M2I2]|uniref:helix-turn-helix domain-containing protein n=1 Tax=Actinoplanes sp. M2I2 TaxID=1734444 RepID=UPI0020203063|nr:helix-turn-helix transcriptional regulator [Actinoplanes sp. M2I2]